MAGGRNLISQIPDYDESFKHLQYLTLYHNQLTEISGIEKMRQNSKFFVPGESYRTFFRIKRSIALLLIINHNQVLASLNELQQNRLLTTLQRPKSN